MFLREVAKIQYLLTSRSFFLASRSTGISSWPLPHNTWSLRGRRGNLWKFQKFTAKFNLNQILVHYPYTTVLTSLYYWFTSQTFMTLWTHFEHDWSWSDREENTQPRRLHITIIFFSCLVVFGVFPFLLASAQVMYTSHRLRVKHIQFGLCVRLALNPPLNTFAELGTLYVYAMIDTSRVVVHRSYSSWCERRLSTKVYDYILSGNIWLHFWQWLIRNWKFWDNESWWVFCF